MYFPLKKTIDRNSFIQKIYFLFMQREHFTKKKEMYIFSFILTVYEPLTKLFLYYYRRVDILFKSDMLTTIMTIS